MVVGVRDAGEHPILMLLLPPRDFLDGMDAGIVVDELTVRLACPDAVPLARTFFARKGRVVARPSNRSRGDVRSDADHCRLRHPVFGGADRQPTAAREGTHVARPLCYQV